MPAQTGGKRAQVAKRTNATASARASAASASAPDVAARIQPKEIWAELKKVVWPGTEDLTRMTGVVIATVLLFAVLIGGVDYILAFGVQKVYNQSASVAGSSSNNGATPTP